MAHEFLIEPAHPEAQRHIHPGSPKEVIARQSTGQTSRVHEWPAVPNGGLYISRDFPDAVFTYGRAIPAGLKRAGDPGQLQPQQVRDSSRKSKNSQEESSIGD
jgi:hypothetical protein